MDSVNKRLVTVQLLYALAIIKVPGHSKLDSEEAKGHNLAAQAARTAALTSFKTKAHIANITYFPKGNLKFIIKDAQSRAPYKEKLD